MVQVEQPVVVAVQRGGQVEPVREVVVLAAPALVPLVHPADGPEGRGPDPDAAARRAAEQEAAQPGRIRLPGPVE